MNPQDWMKAAAQAATAEEPPTTDPVAAAPEPGAGAELATGSPTPPETLPAASAARTPPSLPAAGGHPAFRTVAPSPATNPTEPQPEPQPAPQPATSRPTPTEDKPVFVDPFSDHDTPAADAPPPAGEQVNPFASLSQPAAAATPAGPEQATVTPTPDAPAGSGPGNDGFAGLFNDALTPETGREVTAPPAPDHTPPHPAPGPVAAADPFAPLTGPGALPSATASTLAPSSVPSPPAVGYSPGLSYVLRGRAAEKLQALADETSKDHGELVETALDLLLMLRKLP